MAARKKMYNCYARDAEQVTRIRDLTQRAMARALLEGSPMQVSDVIEEALRQFEKK